MKRKILFVTPKNTSGGAERVMSTLVNEFSKKYDVVFVTFDSKSDFYNISGKVKTCRLNAGTDNYNKIVKFILLPYIECKRFYNFKRVVKKEKPDCVISFLYTSNILSTIICRQLKIPIILSERNDPTMYNKLKKITMKWFYSKSDGFVCQSSKMKEYAENNYLLDNVVVIPNPLTMSQISDVVKKKKNKIITVGRLIEQKNHKMLIDVFNRIHNEYKNYKLYIYGEGEKRKELEEYVKTLNLQDYIFLPGVEMDVLKNNNDSKLFVLPSNWEGYPNVLVEAMANGICSISSKFSSGSAEDIIENGKNGFLFEVGNLDELTNIIRELLNNEDKIKCIGERGKQIYSSIKVDIIINKWDEYIDKVIRRCKNGKQKN